ncbi:MAG: DUF3784 domain-containing protein [Akkermansia sp.]
MMAGFIILGVILSMGKCSFLIAGYNMMSKEQKKQYDERAVPVHGKLMYCLAFAIALWLISIILQEFVLLSVSPVPSGGLT